MTNKSIVTLSGEKKCHFNQLCSKTVFFFHNCSIDYLNYRMTFTYPFFGQPYKALFIFISFTSEGMLQISFFSARSLSCKESIKLLGAVRSYLRTFGVVSTVGDFLEFLSPGSRSDVSLACIPCSFYFLQGVLSKISLIAFQFSPQVL